MNDAGIIEPVAEAVQIPTATPTEKPDTTSTPPSFKTFSSYVGINEAARLTKKTKTQIYRDVSAGKLSWQVDTNGKRSLQIADLHRVYGVKPVDETSTETSNKHRLPPPETAADTTQATPSQAAGNAVKLAVLEERLQAKEALIQMQQEQITDLRDQRDKLQETTHRLTLLLPAPQQATTPEQSAPLTTASPAPEQPIQKPNFWGRLLGK